MTMLHDTVPVSRPRITKDGYLAAEARVARTGIQIYYAGELGLDGDPYREVRVYRPPEEVFAADAMQSYAHRPLTVDHPRELVDASNWDEYAKGHTGDEVLRDGQFVRVPMLLMDAKAVKEWDSGKRELSMGYTMDLDVTSGTTEDGEPYEAVQRNLRMNHLALVTRARGGSELKLGDDQPEDSIVDLRTVTIDGLSVKTTDQGAEAIVKLQGQVADAQTALEQANTAHAEAIKAKDTELAQKDAEIDALKGKVLDDAALDALVKERAQLLAVAGAIAKDTDFSGMTPTEIRKATVVAALGADAVADKGEAYIEARFDILADEASKGADPVRNVLSQGKPATDSGDGRQAAFDNYLKRQSEAWKGNTEVN